MDDVIIVTSPKAGSGAHREQVPRLEEMLRRSGRRTVVTTSIAEMVQQIEQSRSAGGSPILIPAGGDGTVSLVADNVDPETRMVPLPLGTENLLARHFGHLADADQVMRTICDGVEYRMDAGRANGRLFLVMVSCGFDADVVRGVHLRRRGHINRFSYAKPIMRSMARYRFPSIRVYIEDQHDSAGQVIQSEPLDVGWAMAFNLPSYGGGLRIEPDAIGDDGSLDLITFGRRSLISGLGYVMGIFTGRHLGYRSVQRQHVRSLRIESDDRVPYQIDGDYAGKLPLKIETLPGRVRLLLPPKRDLR